jgi:LysR family transcriptional regulator, regulator of abg operon
MDVQRLASRLRFRHLQLLLQLEGGGSLRAAAQALHLTQPALSKALNEIEGAFGCRLFARTARGLQPTEQGQAALRGARQLLQDLADVQREVASGERAVTLRIGAPPFVAHGYLPPVIARLASSNPPVRVELAEERVPLLLQALADGDLDALVSSYPAQMPEGIRVPLRFEKLFDAGFTIIAAPDHPLAKARRLDWARLAQYPWVMPGRTAMGRRLLEESFVKAGVSAPEPVVESTSPVTNLQLVAAGTGLGMVPQQTANQAIASGLVRAVAVKPPPEPGPVALIHRGDVQNPRVALLREALRYTRSARHE